MIRNNLLESVLIFTLILSQGICYAQGSNGTQQEIKGGSYNFVTITGEEVKKKDFNLDPGMELISIRGVNVVAPKGTKVVDKGSWIKVEDVGEFLGRRFDEIEDHLENSEKQQDELRQELTKIKNTLDELYERSLTSP